MRIFGVIKSSFPTFQIGALVFLSLLSPQISWAAGTPAGTIISNLAIIRYDIGGGSPIDVCSSPLGNSNADDDGVCVPGAFGALVTDFAVDNKVDLLVTEGNTLVTPVVAGQANALTTFTVANTGNSTQDFALSVANLITGTTNPLALPAATNDNFDGAACTISNIVIASGSMGPYTAADQHINTLTADSIATVDVSCNIPAAQANGSLAVVSLTATARNDDAANTLGGALVFAANTENGVEIIRGDAAGSDDAANDAAHSARDAYYVQTATLAINKSVASVLDPLGGAVAMPGSVITYQIAVDITGAGTVTGLVITDPLPTDTTYLTSSISITCNSGAYAGGGACGIGTITPQPAAPKTDTNADADFVDYNGTTANTVTISLGDVTAPANFVITIQATIN